jgi:hypothetical protein
MPSDSTSDIRSTVCDAAAFMTGLRAAEETAHEEVAGRPSVHRVIGDLLVSAPPSIRRDVKEFADQMGVTR